VQLALNKSHFERARVVEPITVMDGWVVGFGVGFGVDGRSVGRGVGKGVGKGVGLIVVDVVVNDVDEAGPPQQVRLYKGSRLPAGL